MKQRADKETGVLGMFLQVVLVGVLLFTIIWQVGGGIGPDHGEPASIPESYTTTAEVNLRSGPGLEHDVLAVMPLHAEVKVTGDARRGFFPVDVDGAVAWVSADYVAPKGSVRAGTSSDLPVTQQEAVDEPPSVFLQEAAAAEVDTSEPVPTEAPVVAEPPAEVTSGTTATTVETTSVTDDPAEPGERWIEVDRSTATVTLHEGDRVVARYHALIGKDPSRDGYYATAVGTFYVHVKERALAETPFAPGVFLTDFVGFDPARSNGFHSPVRDEDGNVVDTGGTTTLGCVRLGEDEARFLYDFASIGMRVEVHD